VKCVAYFSGAEPISPGRLFLFSVFLNLLRFLRLFAAIVFLTFFASCGSNLFFVFQSTIVNHQSNTSPIPLSVKCETYLSGVRYIPLFYPHDSSFLCVLCASVRDYSCVFCAFLRLICFFFLSASATLRETSFFIFFTSSVSVCVCLPRRSGRSYWGLIN